MPHPEAGRLLQVGFHVLHGKAQDEVYGDAKAPFQGHLHRPKRPLPPVGPPQELEDQLLEALHPQGEAVHPEVLEEPEAARGEGPGVGLQGHLGALGERPGKALEEGHKLPVP